MNWSSFKYLTRQGLHNLSANRLMAVASVGVLTACLIVTGMAWLLGANLSSIVDELGRRNEMVVYLQDGADETLAAAAEAQLRAVPGVAQVTYVSSAQVLELYKGYMAEYADLFAGFEGAQNPFRANYRVTLSDLAGMDAAIGSIEAIPGVDKVRAPIELSGLFLQVRRGAQLCSGALVVLLGLVSVAVIGNTIRLAVYARRKEINIMKYVGATNGFIRWPFFVEGLAVGLVSALLAALAVTGSYAALLHLVRGGSGIWLLLAEGGLLPLGQVWYRIAGGFLAFGALLGSLGTAGAVRSYLNV